MQGAPPSRPTGDSPLPAFALGTLGALLLPALLGTTAFAGVRAPLSLLLVLGAFRGRGRWRHAMLGLLAGTWAGPGPERPLGPLPTPRVLGLAGQIESVETGRFGPSATLRLEAAGAGAFRQETRGALRLRLPPWAEAGPATQRAFHAGASVSVRGWLAERAWRRNPGPARASRDRAPLPELKVPVWDLVTVHAPGPWLPREIARARRRARACLLDHLPPADAGLLLALVLGDRGRITPEDLERVRDTGQAHLLAVSGLHVGLLLYGLLRLLARCGMPRAGRAGCGLVVVLLYVPFTGASASTLRAGAGAALFLLGQLLGRRADIRVVLACVFLAAVLPTPERLDDLALTLSFTAVLGIVFLAAPIREALRPPPPPIPGLPDPPRRFWIDGLAVALAAWLATAPPVAGEIGRLCLLGAPLSLLALPFVAVLIGLGLLVLLLADLPVAGDVLTLFVGASADALRLLCDACRSAGLGATPVDAPPAWLLAAHLGCLLGVIRAADPRRRRGWLLGTFALPLILVFGARGSAARDVEAWILDVGHGQSVLLREPGGAAVLVDAGRKSDPTVGQRLIVRALDALGVRALDALVLSHADEDHVVGAAAVLRALPVRQLVARRGLPPEIRRAALAAGTRLVTPDSELRLWSTSSAQLAVFAPEVRADASPNDRSLSVLLEGPRGHRLLVPGDVEEEGARALLRAAPDLRADVLVLPHHGRPGPGRDLLLRALRPTLRLASTGASAVASLPPDTVDTATAGALHLRLTPGGPTLDAPYAGSAPYHRGLEPMPTPPGLQGPALALACALLVAFAAATVWRGWLTAGASMAAFVLGAISLFVFGYAGLAALLLPFLVSTLLGRVPTRGGRAAHGTRGIRQVLAGGLPALAGLLLAWAGAAEAGAALFVGAMACLAADTCATEIGTRYGGTPRRLWPPGEVPVGASGGVTPLGLLAAAVGASLAPLAFSAVAGRPTLVTLVVSSAGFAGALIDSLLGGTLQFRGRDRNTGAWVEDRTRPADAVEHTAGLRWLDNDGVNFLSGLAAGLLSMAWILGTR